MTRIEYERRIRRWNQTALAYRSRLSQADISLIERRRLIPTPAVVERIARALKVDAAILLDEVPAAREAVAQ